MVGEQSVGGSDEAMMRGGAAVVIDGGGTELNLDGGPQRSEGADAQQR